MLFLLTFRFPRSDFWDTITADERSIVAQQYDYLARIQDEGRLRFAGRAEDKTFGIAIVDVADEAEAKAIVEGSPAVVLKLYRGEVKPYLLPVES